jgi:hypothetical protein
MSNELEDILKDPKKLHSFVSGLVPWKKLLDDYDPSLYRNVVCPFHNDSQPSAKIFKDKDGIERLWCFAENKQYTTADFVTKVKEESLISYTISNFDDRLLRLKAKQFVYEEFERLAPVDFEEARVLLPDVGSFLDKIFFGIPKINHDNT